MLGVTFVCNVFIEYVVSMRACVRAFMRACVRLCVCACVCACWVRACVRVCVHACACMSVCMHGGESSNTCAAEEGVAEVRQT